MFNNIGTSTVKEDTARARVIIEARAVPFASELAGLVDHTLLTPDAPPAQVAHLCAEARRYGFRAACVHPSYVTLAARLLQGSTVRVCTVVGFPLGASLSEVKAYEAQAAIRDGAQELDMVLHIGALKAGDYEWVKEEIAQVVDVCHRGDALCKVIIEAALLTDAEKVVACRLVREAGAEYVKTSTGFGPGGATEQDVALMRQVVGAEMGVKASGGIRTAADALRMIRAGATRIGASAGVKIVEELEGRDPSISMEA